MVKSPEPCRGVGEGKCEGESPRFYPRQAERSPDPVGTSMCTEFHSLGRGSHGGGVRGLGVWQGRQIGRWPVVVRRDSSEGVGDWMATLLEGPPMEEKAEPGQGWLADSDSREPPVLWLLRFWGGAADEAVGGGVGGIRREGARLGRAGGGPILRKCDIFERFCGSSLHFEAVDGGLAEGGPCWSPLFKRCARCSNKGCVRSGE